MPSISSPPPVPSLKEQLVREACSMARRLVTNGARVPPALIQSTDQFEAALAAKKPIDMVALAGTHERLSRLVAPAKPGTLYLLDINYHQKGRETSLGPVKLVRDLIKVAMVCVAIFIMLSVIALVDAHPGVDVFGVENSTTVQGEVAAASRPAQGEVAAAARPAQGAVAAAARPAQGDDHTLLIIKIILQRVFWLAAAGIGASFAMLFQLNDQIVTRTYDPDETASYWVKFFLGLVAGFILVALIPLNTGNGTEGATNGVQALGPPTVALLGGFSASAVYRILTRMVEALESIFSGGAKEQAAAAEKAASARANEESTQGRMAVAGQLVDVQQKLAAGMPPQQAAQQLQQVVAALVPSAFEFNAGQPSSGNGGQPAGSESAPDKVPALAVVAGPAEDVAAQEDTSSQADASAEAARQPAEESAAVG